MYITLIFGYTTILPSEEEKMLESKAWFEVDKEGFKELQLGKSKAYILRELIQNAWDENIKVCKVSTEFDNRSVKITVEDDNPEGFKDLRDAFTLFKHTNKRQDTSKRGRFNIGEKQVIAVCDEAYIETTKGTVAFLEDGRHQLVRKREKGSAVILNLRMDFSEYEAMLKSLDVYLTPQGIRTIVNGKVLGYKIPYKIITANLQTEVDEKGILKKTMRNTELHIHKVIQDEPTFLYELGIPVTSIECQYSIDVQQKIPLNIDRETVSQSFLRDVFAEVLNATAQEITPEQSSQVWIREATGDERIQTEAVKQVIEKRYGDKVLVANPFDRNSIDEAISQGYRVIYGSELSKEEWTNIKKENLILATSDVFGTSFADSAPFTDLTEGHLLVKALAQKIAKRILDINLTVNFVKSQASCAAQYGNGTLTFNISKLPQTYFEDYLRTIKLIVHELGHHYGNHTENSYHEALTDMAQQLVMIALTEPTFFELREA